jgi:hypothetical protein
MLDGIGRDDSLAQVEFLAGGSSLKNESYHVSSLSVVR